MWRFSGAPFGARAALRLAMLRAGAGIGRQSALAVLGARPAKRFTAPLLGARIGRQGTMSALSAGTPSLASLFGARAARRFTLFLLRSVQPLAKFARARPLFGAGATRGLA